MNTIKNLVAAILEVRTWDAATFAAAMRERADQWAQEAYDASNGFERHCRTVDADEAEWVRDEAQRRWDAAHHVRAPFAWAGYHAQADAGMTALACAWAEGLRRAAEYDGAALDAATELRALRELAAKRLLWEKEAA